MYCKNCGMEIDGDINFCPKCGIKQKSSNEPDKTDKIDSKIRDMVIKKKTFIILILIIFSMVVTYLYLTTPETRSVPYQESYQSPVYKTEYYEDPVYVTQSYTYSCGFLNLKTCSDQRQVIDHYESRPKQVFDHYETKYETKYKDVTKMRYEWLISEVKIVSTQI